MIFDIGLLVLTVWGFTMYFGYENLEISPMYVCTYLCC